MQCANAHLSNILWFFIKTYSWHFWCKNHFGVLCGAFCNITFSFKFWPGADPAAGKGGPICWPMMGVPGGRALWRGLQGGSAPLHREILNFWTQFARFGAYFLPTLYWKSLDLFPVKVFFSFFFTLRYRPICKWIIYPAHASPSSSPSYSPFRPIYIISCRYAFVNRSCNIQGQLEVQLWGSKQKRAFRGQSPLVRVRGQSPLKLMLFRG